MFLDSSNPNKKCFQTQKKIFADSSNPNPRNRVISMTSPCCSPAKSMSYTWNKIFLNREQSHLNFVRNAFLQKFLPDLSQTNSGHKNQVEKGNRKNRIQK